MVVCGQRRFMVFHSVARCFAAQRFDVSSWAKANPIKTTTISASLRGFLGDLAAQKLEQQAAAEPIEDDFKIDSRRLLLYTSFTNLVAFTYDKPIYTRLFPRMFPTLIDGVRHWGNATPPEHCLSPVHHLPLQRDQKIRSLTDQRQKNSSKTPTALIARTSIAGHK